jgi:hypothetical protein
MLRRLRLYNRFFAALLLTVSSVSSLLIFPHNVSATSIYDDSYQRVSSIMVNDTQTNAVCSNHDISTSWYSYITDSTKWQNPSDANNPTSDMSIAKASFEAALDHGRWAVSQGSAYGGSAGSYSNYVNVLWAENTDMELIWTPDHSVFASAPYARYITITCGQTYGRGDNPVAIGYSAGSPGPISTSALYDPAPYNSIDDNGRANFFTYTDYPNYPSGYDGDSISSFQQGGIITGNVQCADSSNVISDIGINVQSGVDGGATITDDGIGGKNYRFYLWNASPYSLIVVCDGDIFYGPTVDVNLYNNYNWVCVPTSVSEDPDVKLGTCAAS